MTALELAIVQFEAEEETRRDVNMGRGPLASPGVEWTLWRWEQVSEGGRRFRVAVAEKVLAKLKA